MVTSLQCQCAASKRALRATAAELLLLERDGIKFNGRQCFSYFLQFSRSLDEQFLSQLTSLPSDSTKTATASCEIGNRAAAIPRVDETSEAPSTGPLTVHASTNAVTTASTITGNSHPGLDSLTATMPEAVMEELTSALRQECDKLRSALYLPSEDGNLIPLIFRLADPAYDSEGRFRNAFDIEDDGFEIL